MLNNDLYYKNMSILYAEDEEGIRENISFILSLFFKNVFVAKDGLEALELFEENNLDLLIFDICMPKIDGIEVLRQIRKINQDIPIIVLTAHTEQNYLFRAIELNITRYLLKPFSKDTLFEAIKDAMFKILKGREFINLPNNYTFNFLNNALYHLEQAIPLSSNELKLIYTLSKEPLRIFTFDELIQLIWGWESVSKEALKSLVKTIRRKLPEPLINNVFGVGYTMGPHE